MSARAAPSRPLLRRSPLLPGESLPSLLERLVVGNYYPHLGALQRICFGRTVHQDNLGLPYEQETFLRLADLTRLAPEALFAASSHRFAALLTPPHETPLQIPWGDGTAKTLLPPAYAHGRLRPVSAAQFCPLCLKTAPYHRLAWMPVAAALCLEHHCLLVAHCPGCQKPVSVGEIVRDRCRVCDIALSTTSPGCVTEDALGRCAQQVVQFWWGTAAFPGEYGLPDQPPASLFRLLERLGRHLLHVWKAWPALLPPLNDLAEHFPYPAGFRQRIPPQQMYPLQRAAFSGIANWPQGLFQFLDAYRGGAAADPHSTTYLNGLQRLELLRRDWFPLSDPAYKFVQPRFIEYLLKRHLPLPVRLVADYQEVDWFVELTGLWASGGSPQALNLSLRDLERFFSQASSTRRWPLGCRSHHLIFPRETMLERQPQQRLGWSCAEACTWLRLSVLSAAQVARLVARGLWIYAQPPSRTEQVEERFTRQSVEAFFEKVVQHMVVYEGHRNMLHPLDQAAWILSSLQIDQIDLLLAVLDGFLPAYIHEPDCCRLGGVYFAEEPLYAFPDTHYARCGWIEDHKFAAEKGFSPRVVWAWLEAGLIEPKLVCGQHRFYERMRLEELTVIYPICA